MKRKWIVRLIALSTACALTLSAAAAFAEDAQAPAANEKDETVYVLCDPDGKTQRIIESVWLKNAMGADTISDTTSLSNIEPLTEGASFAQQDGGVVWTANGKDVRYRGDGTAELPLSLTVAYSLDGQTLSAEKIAGQSGHASIRFSYDCTLKDTRDVSGAQTELTSSFGVLTVAVLDDKDFSNIAVTNGFTFDDGSKTFVAGYAFPGLQNDLALSEDVLSIPDGVTIEADTVNFSLVTALSVATNEFYGKDPESLLDEDELRRVFSILSDTPEKLIKASAKKAGTPKEILDDTLALIEALPDFEKDAKDNGASAQKLQDSAQAASTALAPLAADGDALAAQASDLMDRMLADWSGTLSLSAPLTREGYADALTSLGTQAALQAKAQLDAMAAVYEGALSLSGDAQTAAQAGTSFADDTAALAQSASSLYESISAQSETIALLNNKILKEAFSAFRKNLEGYADSLKATADLSGAYTTYAGRAEGTEGSVRFIFRTDSIKGRE